MKILTVPHTILTQKACAVNTIDKRILRIIDNMKTTLDAQTNPLGVGLAAPQVGIPLRIFIVKPTKKSPIEVFINPIVINSDIMNAGEVTNQQVKTNDIQPKINHQKSSKLEGCLSLPLIWGSVGRQKEICIAYTSVEKMDKRECFDGSAATIVQHELDHLEGIIFTQRVIEQNQNLYEEKNGELVKLTLE